ncbi:MAG: ribonuclease III domain-containing protein [Candidatus Avigastranaerophilus sp.]
MKELNIKNYAHIGDAVYEVFIREKTIMMTSNLSKLHKLTVSYVNAGFQTELLEKLTPFLTEAELELSRRARNIPISSSRRTNRALHASATSLEVVLGYNYVHNKKRFDELCRISEDIIDFFNNKEKTENE